MPTEAGETVAPVQPHNRSLAWGMRWFAIGLACSYIVRLLRGAVLPKLLPPDQYGLAVSLVLPLSYLRYSDLGVLDQLAKRLPFVRANEGEEGFRRHVSLGAGWTIATSILSALGLIILSFWVTGAKGGYYRDGLRILALMLVIQRVHYLLTVVLNAQEEFRSAQMGGMLVEICGFVFSVAGVLLLGSIGVIWALLFTEITVSIYLATKAGIPRLCYAFHQVFAMVREGFLLLCLALSEIAMMTVDQVFLLRFFSLKEYGLYLIGGALTNFLLMASTLFEVAQPRVMRLTGLGLDKEAKAVVSSTLTLYGLGLAVALGMLAPVSTFAVRYYLTKYQAGVGLYILLPALAIGRGPVIILRPFFLARNEERLLIMYQIAGLLGIVILDSLVIAFRGGLVGIGLASICGYGMVGSLLIIRFEGSLAEMFRRFKRYALLVAASLGIAGIYQYWRVISAGTSHPTGLVELIKAAIVYELAMIGVIYWTRKEWLGALRVVRAHPTLTPTETGIVLSEIELSD